MLLVARCRQSIHDMIWMIKLNIPQTFLSIFICGGFFCCLSLGAGLKNKGDSNIREFISGKNGTSRGLESCARSQENESIPLPNQVNRYYLTDPSEDNLIGICRQTTHEHGRGGSCNEGEDADDAVIGWLEEYIKPQHRQLKCTDIKDSYNFTFVTALFDIGREKWPHFQRLLVRYLANAVPLLLLDVPLVVYLEPKLAKYVQYLRRGKERITEIHAIPFRDLEYYNKYYDKIERVMQSETFTRDHRLLGHPEGFSPEYNVLMNSKIWMLQQVARQNTHNVQHFYWMDMGYGHGYDVYPRTCHWNPENLMTSAGDRVTYVAVNNLTLVQSVFQLYKQRVGPGVSGAFFGGTAKAIERYNVLYSSVVDNFLANDMIDDDQTLAVECFLRQPDLFNMVRGDWYDVFNLFH